MPRASLIAVVLLVACGHDDGKQTTVSAGVTAQPSAAPVVVKPPCPATGLWAECSVMERLSRAGLAIKLDSTTKPNEKTLSGPGLLFHVGRNADLAVFLYPDAATRAADAKKLDMTQFVDGTAEQTIRRERTLIQTGNLLAMLTSLSATQRERVFNALTAGAPQP